MIKYGSHVAFLKQGEIRFGYVESVNQRTDHRGETTEYNISWEDAKEVQYGEVITNEDDIVDLERWNKDDLLLALAGRSNGWKSSKARSDAILNPPEPIPAEVPPAPVVTDGVPPKEIQF